MGTQAPPSAAPAPPAAPTPPTYCFDEFTLDVGGRRLLRGDTAVALPSRAFDTLVYLVERRDTLVRKNELIDAIWHDVVVTDDSLTHAISVVRRALADERAHPRYIETVPRRGYRFVGAVRAHDAAPAQPLRPAPREPASPDEASAASPRTAAMPRRKLTWLAMSGTVAALAVAASLVVREWPLRLAHDAPRSVWLSQPPPPSANITGGGVLSPDGRYLAFIARDDVLGKTGLWVRSLGSNALDAIAGTEGASKPFWSPDARRIGFFANGKLMTVDLAGEALQTVATVDVVVAGGTWGPDDTILFALWPSGIYSVPASGDGNVETIAKLDRDARDIAFAWPQFLPDGRRFLYQVISLDPERSGTYVGSLDARESVRLLTSDSAATFAAPRHLLYVENNLLIAEEIDLERLELLGRASVVARDVAPLMLGADNVVSAAGGLLAFQHGIDKQNLGWFDRDGQRLGTLATPTVLFSPRISPDQSRLVATSAITTNPGLWLANLERGEVARLETDAIAPLWAPDGARIAFTARDGFDLLVRTVDGSEPAQLLISDDTIKLLGDWSPDGKEFVYTRIEDATRLDLWTARADDGAAHALLATAANEMQARISPDGRWLAYASDESGVLEVYVERYPGLGGKRLVSVGGGGQPQWRADQRELFYLSTDRSLMSVQVRTATDIEFDTPRQLFRPPLAGNPADARELYAAAADGSKFLIDAAVEQATERAITVVVNWSDAAAERPLERLSRLR